MVCFDFFNFIITVYFLRSTDREDSDLRAHVFL